MPTKCPPGCCRHSTVTGLCIYCHTACDNHDWTVYQNGVKCSVCGKLWSNRDKVSCDCGAKAAGFDVHAHWCSTRKEKK